MALNQKKEQNIRNIYLQFLIQFSHHFLRLFSPLTKFNKNNLNI